MIAEIVYFFRRRTGDNKNVKKTGWEG
jgi:hypothetical protein